MLEVIVIFAFIAVLMTCVALDISIVYALAIGYFIFFFYTARNNSWPINFTLQCFVGRNSCFKTVFNDRRRLISHRIWCFGRCCII